MDSRRLPRTVIDPKVRQVGFFTSGDPPPARSHSIPADATVTSDLSFTGNSLSPVMIPPLRHISPLRREEVQMPIGSYNPSESFLGVSPSTRGSDGWDNSEAATSASLGITGSIHAAASLPRSGGEMMTVVRNDETRTLPGVTEEDGTPTDMNNEGAGTGRPHKQKTTRAERRAIQEAQRASKGAAVVVGKGGTLTTSTGGAASEKRVGRNLDKDRKKDIPQPQMQFDDQNRVEKAKKRAIVSHFEARNRVELFRHLPQYEHGPQLPYLESKFFGFDHIHPSVYKVGLQYLSGTITGGNARCREMLQAFREAIIDYSTPPERVLVRDLTSKIGSYVSFLIECRPLSVGMGNAIRFLKNRVAKLHRNLSELEAKSRLLSDIDRFINEKIIVADKIIVQHAVTKIRDGDVLLIYGYSTVVEMILLHAHEQGKQFRVVIVDSRPKLEGKTVLRKLVMKGLSCTYTHLNAVSYVMHGVKRVFLGASAILANGTVFSRVGTASIAMVAHEFRVPVLICCEAYKFHERVQLDSICSNELGDPDVISNVPGKEDSNHLANWADHKNLQLLNLFYDATPSDYVSMIVTEHGMVPPTSVPVIVREYGKDQFIF